MAENVRKLIDGIAPLLAQPLATHPEFFEILDEELAKRGYRLIAEQRGIAGTYVRIVKDK